MRKSSSARVLAGFACAVMLTACGADDGANEDRAAQTPDRAQQGAPAQALVSLSGCVEAAPGTNQYVLRNVRLEPRGQGDPQAATTTPAPQGITEGAWVRLNAGDQDLNAHLGQRVTLSGTIIDSGQNTVGTAGTSGEATPSGDKSQAASSQHHSDKKAEEMGRIARESMATGMAAEVRVQQVQGTGDRCQQELRPEKR
jgi:hypothetical protein